MSTWQEILLIAGMVFVTFGVRYPILTLAGKLELPEPLVRALRYVPVAVLTAIIIPMMLKPEGEIFLSLENAHLVAGVVSMIVALVSRHLLLTIVVGMMVFVVLRYF